MRQFLGVYTKGLTPSVARRTGSIEEPETFPGGIKPRTSHHRSPGVPEVLRSVRRFLGAYTKNITPTVARSTGSTEERETLPGGIKPRTSHHRSPGSPEVLRTVKHFLGAYTKGITPTVARSTGSTEERETLPGGIKPRTTHHRSPGGQTRRKRWHSTIFLDRTRRPSSVRLTMDPFQRQRRENL